MTIQTINQIDGSLIYEGEYKSIKEAVEYCIIQKINLSGANLSYADLSYAYLSYADLSYANLFGANLSYANLSGADLSYAKYSILSLLKINWNHLSNLLTLELMQWDAISCSEEKMQSWADGGNCPFDILNRDFYFKEKRELWKPGKPIMNHRELFIALCKEKNIKISI